MTKENKAAIASYMEARPHIDKVFLNEAGEWLFVKREGYDNEITREEILGPAKAEDTEEITREEKNNTTSKAKKS